jgi:hypothetical protein
LKVSIDLTSAVAVEARGVGQDFEHRLLARQVEIGRDRAELEVKVDDADAHAFGFGDQAQFPRKVAAKVDGADAAGHAVHGQDDAVAVTLGLEDRVEHAGFGVIAVGHDRGGLAQAFDGVMQAPSGSG